MSERHVDLFSTCNKISVALPSIQVVILIVMLCTTRRKDLLDCCGGRPGLFMYVGLCCIHA